MEAETLTIHCPPKYTRNLPCSTCTYISPMKKRAQPSNKPSDAGWAHLGQIDRVTIRITPNFRPMLKQPPFWDVNPRGGSRRLFAALENGGPVLPSPPRRPPPLFGLFPCSAFFPPTDTSHEKNSGQTKQFRPPPFSLNF